jgi:hypothetical protein
MLRAQWNRSYRSYRLFESFKRCQLSNNWNIYEPMQWTQSFALCSGKPSYAILFIRLYVVCTLLIRKIVSEYSGSFLNILDSLGPETGLPTDPTDRFFMVSLGPPRPGLSNAAPVIYFPGALSYSAGFNVNQNFKKKIFLNNSMFQVFS